MLSKIKKGLKEGKTLLQFGFVKGLGLSLGMIAPLIIAKYFNPDLFGSYSLAKMIIFFFTTLLITSSQTPFVVFANRERAETGKINKTFWAQCVFLFAGILVFSMLVIIFRRRISAFAGISNSDIFFMWLAYLGLTAKSFLCNLFLALGQRLRNSLVELIFGILTCLLVIGYIITVGIDLQKVFLVYFFAGLCTFILVIKTIDFTQLKPLNFNTAHFKAMLNYTKWLMIGSTAIYFVNWGDNLVLKIYHQPMGDIGVYNLAYQVFKCVATLTGMIHVYFLPFVSTYASDNAKIQDYLTRKRPKVFVLGICMISLIFVAAYFFFRIFYANYTGCTMVMSILFINTVIILYCTFYSSLYYALKKYKFMQVAHLSQVFSNLLLDFILVPYVGMIGAAIATVCAYLIKAIMYELYYRIYLKPLIQARPGAGNSISNEQ